MSLPPETITVGKCFATPGNQVRRVVSIIDGIVSYEARGPRMIKGKWPSQRRVSVERFAADVAKEVPCHYDPDFGATSGL
jgi:hypothetical protein